MAHDEFLIASRRCFDGDFDTQVNNILQDIRLTRSEVENLRYLFDDLEKTLQFIWPGCEVHPFGSIVTGLGIKTSDVDCYVRLIYGQSKQKNVILARNVLRRYPDLFQELFAITNAKVPIVKFLYVPTQTQCDVNFKSPSGVRNSKLFSYLLQLDNRVLPVAVLIKYLLKVYKFTGTNLMSNYALTLLVIFYLQQLNILPPVCDLQRYVPSLIVDNWNTAFEEQYCALSGDDRSLYEVLGGFFKYYSSFNFGENIISTFVGRPIKRNTFRVSRTVPEVFSLYKYNVDNGICQELRVDSKICVQDPFEHCRNCSAAIYPHLASNVISLFSYAAKKFEENKDNFLKAIFTEYEKPREMTKKQRHALQNKINKKNSNTIKKTVKKNITAVFAEINKMKNQKKS